MDKAGGKDAVTSSATEHDLTHRERHLELWLGETYETVVLLLDIYDTLLVRFLADSEAHSGARILSRISTTIRQRLEPHVKKFGRNQVPRETHSTRPAGSPLSHRQGRAT